MKWERNERRLAGKGTERHAEPRWRRKLEPPRNREGEGNSSRTPKRRNARDGVRIVADGDEKLPGAPGELGQLENEKAKAGLLG